MPEYIYITCGDRDFYIERPQEETLNHNQQEIAEILSEITLPEKMEYLYSSDSPLDKPVHGIPRLNLLVKESLHFQLYENGKFFHQQLDAPAFYYCTASGYQWAAEGPEQERQAISFCYFKEYIRVVIVHSATDVIYYHSPQPLSSGGFMLLEALEHLQQESAPGEVVLHLMKALFSVTVDQLCNMEGNYAPRLNRNWEKINSYLRAHRTENLSREKLAELFHLSPGSLSRLAKKYTGMEFSRLRLIYKLELADELLHSTDMTADEIAARCGFNYTSYFYRCFNNHFGVTPRQRREENF